MRIEDMLNKIFLETKNGFEFVKEIPDKSIDMILCDLPYGTTKCAWDSIIDLDIMWYQYKRIIKDFGVIVLTAQTPFDKILGASNLDMLRYEWIWEKTQATGHLNAKKMPLKAHENVLIFYKHLPIYNPQKTSGHERKVSTAKHKRDTKETELYGKCDNYSDYDSTDRYPRSVLVFPSDKQKSSLHPTQKPVALFEYFIKTYTKLGAVVLDNCVGGGTTAEACVNTNRNFIAMEITQNLIDISYERLSKIPKWR